MVFKPIIYSRCLPLNEISICFHSFLLLRCFCRAEGTDQNFPDVYINFIYELDEKGTRWFNNKDKNDNGKVKGFFSFKVKFPLNKKKNGKVC